LQRNNAAKQLAMYCCGAGPCEMDKNVQMHKLADLVSQGQILREKACNWQSVRNSCTDAQARISSWDRTCRRMTRCAREFRASGEKFACPRAEIFFDPAL
jgi:hypothetical protein